jgi:hypothetical protein
MSKETANDRIGWILALCVVMFCAGRCSVDVPATQRVPLAAIPDAHTPAEKTTITAPPVALAVKQPSPPVESIRVAPALPVEPQVSYSEPQKTEGLSCGSKRLCRQMNSCSDAMHYLNDCGIGRLDGDGDGVPCESICG